MEIGEAALVAACKQFGFDAVQRGEVLQRGINPAFPPNGNGFGGGVYPV